MTEHTHTLSAISDSVGQKPEQKRHMVPELNSISQNFYLFVPPKIDSPDTSLTSVCLVY